MDQLYASVYLRSSGRVASAAVDGDFVASFNEASREFLCERFKAAVFPRDSSCSQDGNVQVQLRSQRNAALVPTDRLHGTLTDGSGIPPGTCRRAARNA
jgi:hypothetical protein